MKTCVPKNDLSHFLLGQLDSDRLTEIAAHVDACQECQDTVVALAGDEDTFVGSLKAAQSEEPYEQEAALRQGIRRLVGSLKNFGSTADPEATAAYIYQIGPYVLEESLGSGGMGTVYRAVHSKLKRDVAVKLLPEARWSNAEAISRFEREMEAIGQLDHPHIVRASDAGEDQGMHYLVMDYVEGLDLSRLSNRIGQLPVADACELARQAALGLQYVHENGLVHRDIKPSNLMLAWNRSGTGSATSLEPRKSPEASLRILDLGLALLGDEQLEDVGELTSVGQLMGTLDYMSPEQGIDSHGVDHRTDIYGLGATLFKLLTGRAPYADPRYGSLIKKMTALATKSAPSIGSIRKDLPKSLVKVVDRMLARDPDERYASAAEVVEALTPLTKNADLGRLLQNGLENEMNDGPNRLAVAQSLATLPRNTRQNPGPKHQQATSPERGGSNNIWKWLIATAAAGAIIWAGVAYYISTDYGTVIVKSDQDSLKVSIRSVEGETKSLDVEHGDGRTQVKSGGYVVDIEGEVNDYEISPREFRVKRGERQTVQISLRGQGSQNPEAKPKAITSTAEIAERMNRLSTIDASLISNRKLLIEKYPNQAGQIARYPASVVIAPGERDLVRLRQISKLTKERKQEEAKINELLNSLGDAKTSISNLKEMLKQREGLLNPLTALDPATMSRPEMEAVGITKLKDLPRNDRPTKYEGLTWSQWADQVATERDSMQLQNGFRALPILAESPEQQSETAKLICRVMRTHGGVSFKNSGSMNGSMREVISGRAAAALLQMEPEHTVDVLLDELKSGNRKSRMFASSFLRFEFPCELGEPDDYRRLRTYIINRLEKPENGFPEDGTSWVPVSNRITIHVVGRSITLEFVDGKSHDITRNVFSPAHTANLPRKVLAISDVTFRPIGPTNDPTVLKHVDDIRLYAQSFKVIPEELTDATGPDTKPFSLVRLNQAKL
ncbi:MAG: serine/threonine-protein kinase, partial [Planctomycetota bacterium]